MARETRVADEKCIMHACWCTNVGARESEFGIHTVSVLRRSINQVY